MLKKIKENWQTFVIIVAIATSTLPLWQQLDNIQTLVEYAPRQELTVVANDLVGLNEEQAKTLIKSQYERGLLKSTYLLNICTSDHVMFSMKDLAEKIGEDEAHVVCQYRRSLETKFMSKK